MYIMYNLRSEIWGCTHLLQGNELCFCLHWFLTSFGCSFYNCRESFDTYLLRQLFFEWTQNVSGEKWYLKPCFFFVIFDVKPWFDGFSEHVFQMKKIKFNNEVATREKTVIYTRIMKIFWPSTSEIDTCSKKQLLTIF